ncbi:MAG: hypothetical protein F6K28_17940, partial [Microcoleus sp. SIO2G3]|nr:hypothetical protein [Microcoleus sp. SIO2G3]
LNFGALYLISFFTRVTAVGISFVLLAPGIAWLAMLPIPFILWGAFAFQSRLGPRYDRVRDQAGLISDRLSNNLSGIATIKSFTAEAYESDRVYQESDAYRRGNQQAIARAILKDPPILILDEATSAVDNETEAAIQRSLAKITQGRTTIAIAHRLSTIRHSHCIYVMENGQIVEQGTHAELLMLDRVYANLWHVQSGDS